MERSMTETNSEEAQNMKLGVRDVKSSVLNMPKRTKENQEQKKLKKIRIMMCEKK